jgi:hypothetical protein
LKASSTSKRKSQNLYDYEKLCQLLTIASSQEHSTGGAKADAVFARFKEAAARSGEQGRSFLSLCSLLDHNLVGHMTREEFRHVLKMMECPLSNSDFEALLHYLVRSSSLPSLLAYSPLISFPSPPFSSYYFLTG